MGQKEHHNNKNIIYTSTNPPIQDKTQYWSDLQKIHNNEIFTILNCKNQNITLVMTPQS